MAPAIAYTPRMVLGVMSDTHGNSALMHAAAEAMTQRFGAEAIFHLGDDYADGAELRLSGYTVHLVPGLWCPEYQNSRVPKRFVAAYDGITISGAHAERDLRYTERAAAIVLTGHTHKAEILLLGRSLYVNPGHLKALISKDMPASYALIEILADTVSATIFKAVSHTPVKAENVPRDALG